MTTDFCTGLTDIEQAGWTGPLLFPEALAALGTRSIVCQLSAGKRLEHECVFSNLFWDTDGHWQARQGLPPGAWLSHYARESTPSRD